MSSTNVNRDFSEFGNKMLIIAILTIINFIIGIVAFFIGFVGIANLVLGIIILVLFFLALGNIKEAGIALNDQNLLDFRSKLILAFIFGLIGAVFFFVGTIVGFGLIMAGATILGIIILVVFLIIGIIFLIIAAVFRIIAWGLFEDFVDLNASLFPTNIAADAKSGANLCKIAAILDLTIILAIIGSLLRIIGYFKLSSLKDLIGAPAAQPTYQPAAQQPVAPPKTTANFCPSCGSQINPGVKYCTECGSEIN